MFFYLFYCFYFFFCFAKKCSPTHFSLSIGVFCLFLLVPMVLLSTREILWADTVFWPGEEIAVQDIVETMNQADYGKGWIGKWRKMTEETRNRQTSWLTPLVTETPRLEQRIRYDVYDQTLPNGNKRWNMGAGKGVNLIVGPTLEFAFSLPQYIYYPGEGRLDGFQGESFLIKNRIMASPEGQKNYVFSVMLAAHSPLGQTLPDYPAHWIWDPIVLFGKGFGNFDFMINLGSQWADGANRTFGIPYFYNIALQYKIGYVTPTIEINSTSSIDQLFFIGAPGLFITPEVLVGRFRFKDDWKLYFGIGYQIAIDKKTVEKEYSNAFVVKFHLLF
ncbi:hypothetical protein A946_01240 [Methylacidiphilum kamchatkense Kam1]|uniref:Outer membrane beta-barrel porin/alpha-amylase n=2 Tax=Methylacidiphilum kamchatkense Kam1 TaxID=1202785 RepID=A0ABR4ZZ47_9BACT|nr:hypothetical protein A946_01240 [Methylacidiphilum kamchatkense Kam1]